MKPSRSLRVLLTLLLIVPYILYCDFWQWNTWKPLVFGWMPWHVFYQVLLNLLFCFAFIMWAKYMWPSDPEKIERENLDEEG